MVVFKVVHDPFVVKRQCRLQRALVLYKKAVDIWSAYAPAAGEGRRRTRRRTYRAGWQDETGKRESPKVWINVVWRPVHSARVAAWGLVFSSFGDCSPDSMAPYAWILVSYLSFSRVSCVATRQLGFWSFDSSILRSSGLELDSHDQPSLCHFLFSVGELRSAKRSATTFYEKYTISYCENCNPYFLKKLQLGKKRESRLHFSLNCNCVQKKLVALFTKLCYSFYHFSSSIRNNVIFLL
jgi:hypothetical protein